MSKILFEDIIGWQDDENHYCLDCAPDEGVRPITIDEDENFDGVFVCDECQEVI